MLNTRSDFSRRLRFYGFGFLLGCILVYFLLLRGKDRTGWLPERRVIDKIDSTLSISSKAKCIMECNSISEGDLKVLLKGSDVNFHESSPQGKPCPVYVLHSKLPSGEEVRMNFASCEKTSTLTEITISHFQNKAKSCPCQ